MVICEVLYKNRHIISDRSIAFEQYCAVSQKFLLFCFVISLNTQRQKEHISHTSGLSYCATVAHVAGTIRSHHMEHLGP